MAGLVAAVAVVVWALCGQAVAAASGRAPSALPQVADGRASQGEPPAALPAGEAAAARPEAHAAEGGEGEAGHGESIWAIVGRLVNFVLLAGGLIYFLRSPLMAYLDQRRVQVRSDLSRAAEVKAEAGAQAADIEARMRALPGEIEALERRGAQEIAAEEARIRAQAEAERQRLLDQAKRAIDGELRVAERELKARAGELAVGVATERVKRTITDADQRRLVDKYVAQVRE